MYNFKYKFKQITRWIKHRTTERYHIIDISGIDDYHGGWIDRDHAMYLACFKLLRDFVELENPTVGTHTWQDYAWPQMTQDDIDAIQYQMDGDNEIREIYTWWTRIRPLEKQRIENILPEGWYGRRDDPEIKPLWDMYINDTSKFESVDDEMFDRLMRVRKRLWT